MTVMNISIIFGQRFIRCRGNPLWLPIIGAIRIRAGTGACPYKKPKARFAGNSFTSARPYLKQFFLSAACGFSAEVFVGEAGCDASSRCAVKIPNLYEEGFVDVFNGILFLM